MPVLRGHATFDELFSWPLFIDISLEEAYPQEDFLNTVDAPSPKTQFWHCQCSSKPIVDLIYIWDLQQIEG